MEYATVRLARLPRLGYNQQQWASRLTVQTYASLSTENSDIVKREQAAPGIRTATSRAGPSGLALSRMSPHLLWQFAFLNTRRGCNGEACRSARASLEH
jgi:hypothetical protein